MTRCKYLEIQRHENGFTIKCLFHTYANDVHKTWIHDRVDMDLIFHSWWLLKRKDNLQWCKLFSWGCSNNIMWNKNVWMLLPRPNRQTYAQVTSLMSWLINPGDQTDDLICLMTRFEVKIEIKSPFWLRPKYLDVN